MTTPEVAVRTTSRTPVDRQDAHAVVAWTAYETVWSFDSALPQADVATLHELRIAAKWLRYTLEFVREPIEPGATELIRRVVVLQDNLGDIHDFHASAALAQAFAADRTDLRAAQRTAIERFAISQDARVERFRSGSGRPGAVSPTRNTGGCWGARSPASDRQVTRRRVAEERGRAPPERGLSPAAPTPP